MLSNQPQVESLVRGSQGNFPSACVLCRFDYPPVNKHNNGKSPFSIGNTSSNGGFSIAMLDMLELPEGKFQKGWAAVFRSPSLQSLGKFH